MTDHDKPMQFGLGPEPSVSTLTGLFRDLVRGNYVPNFHVFCPEQPEYPGKYVAKLFLAGRHPCGYAGVVVLGDSLEELRKKLPSGLMRITPDPFDDPSELEEMWA